MLLLNGDAALNLVCVAVVVDWKGHYRKEPQYHGNTKVLLEVDQVAFKRFYLDRLAPCSNA